MKDCLKHRLSFARWRQIATHASSIDSKRTYAYKFTALSATILNNLDMPIARELTDEVLISHAHELRRRAIQGDMQARELAHEYEIELRIRLKQRTAEVSGNPHPSSASRPDLQFRVTDDFSQPTSTPAQAPSNDVSSQVVDALLRNARELLDMDIVFTSRHSEDLSAGGEFARQSRTPSSIRIGESTFAVESSCERAPERRLPMALSERTDPTKSREESATPLPAIDAFLSAPVILPNGEIYGTLCCVSHRPRSALGNRQVDALRTVAALVSTEIDKIRRMSAV